MPLNDNIIVKDKNDIILKVEDLSISRSGQVIIKDVNLDISKGEFVGIAGPNGSGKTTLLLAILGILKPMNGRIQIFNQKPMSRRIFGRIGWVSQAASNLPTNIKITVKELVKLGTLNNRNMIFRDRKSNLEKIEKAINIVGLQDEVNTDISRLSGGQRQRAVIARCLASDAEFILFDEPLVGIDRDSKNNLLKLLDDLCHDEKKTILIVSHDISAIRQTVHRMIYFDEKVRYDGNPDQLPELDVLASLRGIKPVHDSISQKLVIRKPLEGE